MEEEKTKEGLYRMGKAAYYLRTGFLKRKPDYDKAAAEYSKAALAFRSAKQLEKAADAFMKEGALHEIKQVPLDAALAYEKAGLLLKQAEKLEEAAQVIKQSVSLYVKSGNADLTAAILRRFSQLLESQMPYQVVSLYQWTSELFESDDRFLQALDFTGRASKMLVRSKLYGEAAISLSKEKYLYQEVEGFSTSYRRAVAQCLAHLRNNDFLAASNCVQDSCNLLGFKGSREYMALVQLLKCYEGQDQDGVDKVCSSVVFRHLDENYRDMIKKLTVPGVKNSGTISQPPLALMWLPANEDATI